MSIVEKIKSAVAVVKTQTDLEPEIVVVLGTGLGEFAEQVQRVAIPYENIPGFESSTVPTHAGRLIEGANIGPITREDGKQAFAEAIAMVAKNH